MGKAMANQTKVIKYSELLKNEQKEADEEHPLEVEGEESPAGGSEPVTGTDASGVGEMVEQTTGDNPDDKSTPSAVSISDAIDKDEEAIRNK